MEKNNAEKIVYKKKEFIEDIEIFQEWLIKLFIL